VERTPSPVVSGARDGLWRTVGIVCIGAFMGQVDASITQLVLPDLEQAFGASVRAVSWVAIAYLLVVAATLPVFGRLGDMLGRKRLYCTGFAVFIVGSALCGLAPNLGLLIAARVVQGLGATLIQANSVAIVVAAAGTNRRGQALGVQSAAQAVGLGIGPALGGAIIVALGWRWVFWINVPVGIVGILLGLAFLPSTTPARRDRFDGAGAALLVPALAAILFALNRLGSATTHVLLVAGVALAGFVLLGAFVARERNRAAPLVDLRLFGNPTFTASSIATLLSYAILFGVFFVLPFVFERVYGESALTAGFTLTLIPVALGVMAPFSGALADRFGARSVTVCGMLLVLASLGLLIVALADASAGIALTAVSLIALGVGLGTFTAPNNSAIMAAAPAEESGQAGSLLNVMRALGMSFGIAVASTTLALALPPQPGAEPATLATSASELLAAARTVLVILAAFAALATGLSLVRKAPLREAL
jgi:EmrB/QacA subfamily drug resistance transporter